MSLINTLTSISTDNDGYKIKLNSFMPYPLRFIQRECWWLAAAIGILAILGVFFMPRNIIQSTSRVVPQAVEQTQPADFNTDVAPAATLPVAPHNHRVCFSITTEEMQLT